MWENISVAGIKIVLALVVMGGLIACMADILGKKIGRAHVRFFGLRPWVNARILTVLAGALTSFLSIAVLTATSNTARVALFKMETISAQIRSLEKERDAASAILKQTSAQVAEQNKIIVDLDERIKRANQDLTTAKQQVQDLNDSKEKLAGEVVTLKKNTKILRDDIRIMRQGELLYRGGEVVYAGVLRGQLNHKENEIQLDWLIRSANDAALTKVGVDLSQFKGRVVPQAIVFQQETMTKALETLNQTKVDKFFRVRTVTNVMAGEISPCTLEMFDNVLVYRNGEVIYREEYNIKKNVEKNNEGVMLAFLGRVNQETVRDGVLPDPVTGNVGGMSAESVLKITGQLRRAGKHFVVEAKADGDIYTSGPVRLKFNVAKIVQE